MKYLLLAFLLLLASSVSAENYFYAQDRLLASNNQEFTFHYENYLGSDVFERLLPFGQRVEGDARFSFTGKELDSSLYYFGARYYDANLGKFTSIDPIKENHAYTYVDNNPLNYIDPYGENKYLPDEWTHTVAQKETAHGIKRHYGLTFKELEDANPGVDLGAINPGDALNVPLKFDVFERFPVLLMYKNEIIKSSKDNNVNPNLVGLIMFQETLSHTGYAKKKGLVTNKGSGATGPMQIDARTAEELKVSYSKLKRDGALGVEAGARYIAKLKEKHLGDPGHIAAAYNWGPNKFINALETGQGATLADPVHGRKRPRRFDPDFNYKKNTPSETYNYVMFIKSEMAKIK